MASGSYRVVSMLIKLACRECKAGTNVVHGQIVVPLNLLERIAGSQCSQDNRDRCARPANHRFAMAHFRINYDTFHHAKVSRRVVGENLFYRVQFYHNDIQGSTMIPIRWLLA